MALFESYERRIDKINEVLAGYGISSIEEAQQITKDAGLDVYNQVQQSQSKKDVRQQQKLQQQSEKDFRLSVFLDQLLIREK